LEKIKLYDDYFATYFEKEFAVLSDAKDQNLACRMFVQRYNLSSLEPKINIENYYKLFDNAKRNVTEVRNYIIGHLLQKRN
jgi:hypothetical protein